MERDRLSAASKLALRWRISRKHLIQLMMSNLKTEQLSPSSMESSSQSSSSSSTQPTLNEVLVPNRIHC